MRSVKVLGAVLIVGLVVLGGLWTFQRRLIYFPTGIAGSAPTGWEEVTLTASDGLELTAWLIRAEPAEDRGAAVMLLPGNSGNRSDRVALGEGLAARGYTTLLVDYRGYGGNPGSPSEAGLARDARAALAFIESIDPEGVVYFGESLGSGVAVELASEHPPHALVLRSPFTSLVDVGRHHYGFLPVGSFLKDRYPSLERAGTMDVATLVVAGTADSVVPFEQSQTMATALGAETVVVAGADHNDWQLFADPALLDTIADFLDRSLGR